MSLEKGKTIAQNGLRLRDSPRDGETLGILRKGTEIEVLGRETWLRVNANGQQGFVLEDYVEPVEQHLAGNDEEEVVVEEAKIVVFNSSRMQGNQIRINSGFIDSMKILEQLCEKYDLRLHITSSLREPGQIISNNIVEPASMSNHLIGHAIDMNIVSHEDWFNSTKLSDYDSLPDTIQSFLSDLQAKGLRWGGHFSKPDPVHIDDATNLKSKSYYVTQINKLWGGAVRLI